MLYRKSPLEAGEQSLLEVAEVSRRTVRGEYQLLAVLVQMIEDVEERSLRTRTDKVLDIVHDQHVNLHVGGQEVGPLVPDIRGVHILGLELVAGDIKHHEFRIFLLYGNSYGLGEMGLAETRPSEEEERVERSVAGSR